MLGSAIRSALALLALAITLGGCAPVPVPQTPDAPAASPSEEARVRADAAVRRFVEVVDRVEPVAEAECREISPALDCDFRIVVDDRPGLPPNAFQTRDPAGRPVVALNIPLIATVRNADELAFVIGHEAAHHVLGHIDRQRENARAGALVFGEIAARGGAGLEAVRSAQEVGAILGARSYSKDFELEADALGTVIAARAGYDPVRGAAFFTRLPDPGNRFLGTHPPNAARIDLVRRVAAGL
ncbi:M48 family metallopeptidase [Rhodosalinus sp. FB01]|uniref:M48 family metallopeptidase n=1 Tax=Rhodosalinus sp. FB01 TaxID=3239194 RepID=UPI0035250868